jgi:hypothetical protein
MIVTDVGMGCGGRGSVGRATGSQGGSIRERSTARRRPALRRTAKPCGPGTRCWCQVGGGASAQPGLDKPYSPMTVTRRIRRRGDHGISRKTIAQGRSVAPADTCMLVCAFLCTLAHETAGASQHPAFPAPSVSRGRKLQTNLGRIAPRDRGDMSASLRGAKATKQSILPLCGAWIASLRSQ